MSLKKYAIIGATVAGVFAGASKWMDDGLPSACKMNADGDIEVVTSEKVSVNNRWKLSSDGKNCYFSNGSAPPYIIPAMR